MTRTAALLASIALASCGANETPDSGEAPSPGEETAPSAQTPEAENETTAPTPPAAEPASETEGFDNAALTGDGLGPLRIGMTLEEVNEAAGPDDNPGAVGGPEPEVCDQFHPADAPDGILVMMENGVLSRISLARDSVVETDAGIGLGDGPETIREAYGDAAVVTPGKYNPEAQDFTVWQSGNTSADYVQDPDARGIRYQVNPLGEIHMIHAGGPSIQYVEGCS